MIKGIDYDKEAKKLCNIMSKMDLAREVIHHRTTFNLLLMSMPLIELGNALSKIKDNKKQAVTNDKEKN